MNSKILDCTIRDGGLINNFYFDDEWVKNLYQSNLEAGIDYMEFGYKASINSFDINQYGKWKFSSEEDIRSIVGENNTKMKIAVMADVGRTDYKKDIICKKDSVIDMIRIATYSHTITEAIEMVEYCKEKGYETTVNVMAISNNSQDEILTFLDELGKSNVDYIYLVDSYGSFYPKQIQNLSEIYLSAADKYNKQIGIHIHNNLQLAFANTLEALSKGVSLLDVTINGIGRGAGNCSSELLLGYMDETSRDYNKMPIINFIEKYIVNMKSKGVLWGYDIPYMLTGQCKKHPIQAIKYSETKKTNYVCFYKELLNEL